MFRPVVPSLGSRPPPRPPRDTWQCLERFLFVTAEELLLASSVERPESLLNSCSARDSPLQLSDPMQNVRSAVVEKPWHTGRKCSLFPRLFLTFKQTFCKRPQPPLPQVPLAVRKADGFRSGFQNHSWAGGDGIPKISSLIPKMRRNGHSTHCLCERQMHIGVHTIAL